MALLIKSNGEVKEVSPSNKKHFSLEELQKFVGGYIEKVNVDPNNIFVCNEEGRLYDLPYNKLATETFSFKVKNTKYSEETKNFLIDTVSFVGDILICNQKEFR